MVELIKVSVAYKKEWYALRDIHFKVDKGEFVFLLGPSGAGKSTLLKLIYMDIFPTSGEVIVAGYRASTIKRKEIPLLRRKIGVIFQDFKLLQDRTAYENVAFALEVTNTPRKLIREKVMEVLADVHLSHKRNAFPYQLSGGEQQRVAIARALVREPFILLADEPTGNVDPEAAEEILSLLRDINAKGTAVVMATHDLELVARSGARRVILEDGSIVEDKTPIVRRG